MRYAEFSLFRGLFVDRSFSFYDSEGLGFLREQDLENYVYDHIPTMPALRAIHDNFYPFYVFTAVRRFMFFLDPKRTGM